MKLCLLTTRLSYGGAEAQVVRLAIAMRHRGWDVFVVSLLPPIAHVEALRNEGVPVETVNMRRGVADPRAVWRLARLLGRQKTDVLCSFLVHANILARITRLFVKLPVLVCSARNVTECGRSGSMRLRDLAYRLTDFLCDITVQNSKAGAERYVAARAVPGKKMRRISNFVELEKYRRDIDVRRGLRLSMGLTDEFVWLSVGRFEPQKNYSGLIEAFSRVSGVRAAVLLLVGTGSEQSQIERSIGKLGISERVRILGVRDDVPQLMSAADGFVLSSAWEGLPNVLIEAAACNLPSVATDVGGSSEVVLDGRTGFLVAPRNNDQLAVSMMRLMDLDMEERVQFGIRARRHVEENYSVADITDQWERLWRSLLGRQLV